VTLYPGRLHAHSEAWEFSIPDHVIARGWGKPIDHGLRQLPLGHLIRPDLGKRRVSLGKRNRKSQRVTLKRVSRVDFIIYQSYRGNERISENFVEVERQRLLISRSRVRIPTGSPNKSNAYQELEKALAGNRHPQGIPETR